MIFISYDHRDKAPAHALADFLEDRGFEVFIDRDRKWHGVTLPEKINSALTESAKMLLLIGRTKLGGYQQKEYAGFDSTNKEIKSIILPNAVEDNPLPMMLRGNVWVDLRSPDNDPLEDLCNDLDSTWSTRSEREPKEMVYIGETHRQERTLRIKIRSIGLERGKVVLSRFQALHTAENYIPAIEKDLRRVGMSIHLVGDQPSETAPSAISAQVQCAEKSTFHIRRIYWCSDRLMLDKVDGEHGNFVRGLRDSGEPVDTKFPSGLHVCSGTELENRIRCHFGETLEPGRAIDSEQIAHCVAYVVHSEVDKSYALQLKGLLAQIPCHVSMSSPEAFKDDGVQQARREKLQRRHREWLSKSHYIAYVHGATDDDAMDWLSARGDEALDMLMMQPDRARDLFLCCFSPKKEPDTYPFYIAGMKEIDFQKGVTLEENKATVKKYCRRTHVKS
jgi:hypothetical protein